MSKTNKVPKRLVFADNKQDEEADDFEVVPSMAVTKETIFIKEIEKEGRKSTILYDKNQPPKLVFERSATLINKLDYCRSYPNSVLVEVFSRFLPRKGYCNPYLSHKGLFAPSGAPSKGGCSWFDVMKIVRIDTFKDSVYSESKTLCTFCDGLQVVFSKSKNDFKKKLMKDLHLYLAYYLYERTIHKFEGTIFNDRTDEIRELYLKLTGRTSTEFLILNIEQVTAYLNKASYLLKYANKPGGYTKKEILKIAESIEKDYCQ